MKRKTKATIKKELEQNLNYYATTRLWSMINEFMPFGITLPNGKIVYAVIYSMEDLFDGSIFVFTSKESFITFENMFGYTKHLNMLKRSENYLSQDALAIIFDRDQEEASFRPEKFGKQVKAQYLRFKPHKLPQTDLTKKELAILLQVVRDINFIAEVIDSDYGDKILDRFHPVIEGRGLLPIFEIEDDRDTFHIGTIVLDYKPKRFLKVKYDNELMLAKLKSKVHYGSCALELFYSSVPILLNEETKEPGFVNGVILYDFIDDYIEPILIENDAEDNPQAFVQGFAQELTDFDKLPSKVYIRDPKTFSLLEDMLTKAGIQVIRQQEIPELDYAENDIFNYEAEDQMRSQEITVEEVDKLLKNLSYMGSSPYSGRLKRNLDKLREDLIEARSQTEELPEEFNPNYGYETYFFKYNDSLGNSCMIRTTDILSFNDLFMEVLKLLSEEQKSITVHSEELSGSYNTDSIAMSHQSMEPGDKLAFELTDETGLKRSVSLEMTKMLPEAFEGVQIFQELS